MRLSIFSALFFTCFFGYSQTVNGYKLDSIPANYIELVGRSKLFKPFQVNIHVDYGQISKAKEMKKGLVLGKDGKQVIFNGMIGALNLFYKKGWEFRTNYVITMGGDNVYHFLLEKVRKE